MARPLILFLFVVLGLGQLADAQSRDVYTIRGIPVDERASDIREAQQNAFAAAKFIGAQQIIQRITLPTDLQAATGLTIDAETADLLAAAVDVEEEVAGAGRYRGRLAVVFNPVNVRAFLDQFGVPYTDATAPPALIIPVSTGGLNFAWTAAWPERSSGALAPTVTSQSGLYNRGAEWTDVQAEVAVNGARRAILAELTGTPGAYRVALTALTAGGNRALGETLTSATLDQAATAAQALLDLDWKQTSIIRETGQTMIEATVLYTSLAEWNTLRGALARSPLVSDFQTRAVARDGAVVAFVFAGDGSRLVSDLRDRGVTIREEVIGWVLTSASTAAR
ncbi:MAG: hypothetical protein AAGF20_12555 [Pseudomonadota bacterium]